MARSQDPDSAGSQFFIVVKDSNFLDRQYTAFGARRARHGGRGQDRGLARATRATTRTSAST